MPGGQVISVLGVCLTLLVAPMAHAESRTFADLLAKAQAQAADGHLVEPPGDNMTDTIIGMMDLVPTATPAELAQLSALLDKQKAELSLTKEHPVQSATEQAKPADPTSGLPVKEPPQASAIAAPAPRPDLSEQAKPADPTSSLPVKDSPKEPAQAFATATPEQGPDLLEQPRPQPDHHDVSLPNQPGPIERPKPPPVPGRAVLLYARGVDAEHRGDFSGARRFYLSAAEQGDAAAARNLGRLYDPAYLSKRAVGGIDPDPVLAQHWYERAVRLGDAEAAPLLQALSMRQ